MTAYRRLDESLERKLKDKLRSGTWKEAFDKHFYGAAAEIAVARYLGIYCPLHINQFKGMESDLPGGIEVRWSNTGFLVFRPDDDDLRIFYLVSGEPPDLFIEGKINGVECRNDWWLRDVGNIGKPAYFVPKEALILQSYKN